MALADAEQSEVQCETICEKALKVRTADNLLTVFCMRRCPSVDSGRLIFQRNLLADYLGGDKSFDP